MGAAAGRVGLHNTGPGQLAAGSTDAVNRSQLDATNTALGDLTTNVNNGAVGPVQRTGATNHLALVAPGGTGTDAVQGLVNVAAGAVNVASRDAINGFQLFGTANSVATALGGGSIVNPDGTVSSPIYTANPPSPAFPPPCG